MTTITATTPPTVAAVLSAEVDVVHCGSPNELMAIGQLLPTFRRNPCTAMVESAWAAKVSKYANSCELSILAVPCNRALNVTCCSELSKH